MRAWRVLACAVVGLVGVSSTAQRAEAQFLVEDIAAIKQFYDSYVQDLKGYAIQLEQAATVAQQLQWAINTYQSWVAYPSLANAMGLLNAIGISNPLPFSPYAIQGMISGHGGQGGIDGMVSNFSQLSSFANTAVGTNRVYPCNSPSWECRQRQDSAYGIAGQQAIGQTMLSQMSQHVPVLEALRADYMVARTPAEREHIMGQIQSETAWIQQANTQLQATGMLAQAERDNRVQRADEAMSKGVAKELADAKAAGVWK